MTTTSYRVTLGMAMAALAALPWMANAQGVGAGVGVNAGVGGVGVGAGTGANVNAGVAGGTTSGNITAGTSGNAAVDVSGPRGALRPDPADPNVLNNASSDMDGHINDAAAKADAKVKTGTVKKGPHYRTTHGTVKTKASTHGTVKVD